MSSSPEKPSHTLTLEIDGPRITADKFRKSIDTFFDIIDDVARNFSGGTRAVKWIVSVRSGSAMIILKAESVSPRLPPERVPVLLDVIQTGLQTIEKSAVKPPYFSDSTLKKAKDLASVVDGDIDSVRVSRDDRISSITPHTSANIGALFATAYKDWGSVEGTVQVISKKGKPLIQIYDDVSDKYINCRVGDETLREMLEMFEQRVSVFGLIRYDPSGNIKDIEVEKFKAFPPPETIPSFADVRGIFKGAD